jgi:hypothetical protein
MAPKTHTPCTIRWRKLPSHSRTQGWVGIPYHTQGERWDTFRYYVTPLEKDGLTLWTQWGAMLVDPTEDWEFNIDGEPLTDPEVCKMRCHLNWVTTLADEGA